MGGTMEYQRLRARNGLNGRRMEGDPYGLPTYGKPDTPEAAHPTIRTDYLQGEMNRMEQSYMGVLAGMNELPKYGAAVTGLTEQQVLAVMRWFFGLREPYCDDCAKTTHPIAQRCWKHQRGDKPPTLDPG